MSVRRKISIVIGCVQSTLGALTSVFAYILYYNTGIQGILNVSSGDVASYMVVFMVFGVLSTISGLFLVASEE